MIYRQELIDTYSRLAVSKPKTKEGLTPWCCESFVIDSKGEGKRTAELNCFKQAGIKGMPIKIFALAKKAESVNFAN